MKKYFLFIVISFCFSACAVREKAKFPTPSEMALGDNQKEEIFNKISKNKKEFSNVRFLTDVVVVENGVGYKFRYLFLYDKNGYLRVEAFPPDTFLSLHILTQNKCGAVFLDRQQKIVLTSDSANDILKKLWKEEVDYKSLLESFVGNSDLSYENLKNYDFYILSSTNNSTNKKEKLLQVISKDKNEYIEFDLNNYKLLNYDLWDKGKELKMRLKKSDNMVFVIFPQANLYMNFNIIKQEYDATLDPKIYIIKIPSNYKKYEL
ncbi:MAG: hypothetical protein ACOX3T_03120 [Bdellovibrionota bacterium]